MQATERKRPTCGLTSAGKCRAELRAIAERITARHFAAGGLAPAAAGNSGRHLLVGAREFRARRARGASSTCLEKRPRRGVSMSIHSVATPPVGDLQARGLAPLARD